MEKCLSLLTLSFVIFAGAGCSKSVSLVSADGKHSLVYDCGSFQPKVETQVQIGILVDSLSDIYTHASKNDNFVSIVAIQKAVENGDWRTVERLAVEYKCQHSTEFK